MRHSEFRGVEESMFYILLLELPLVGSKWLPALLFLNRQVLEVKMIQFSFTLRSPATHELPRHRQGCACLPSLKPAGVLAGFAPCQEMPCTSLKTLSLGIGHPGEHRLSSGLFNWSSSKIKGTKMLIEQHILKDGQTWFQLKLPLNRKYNAAMVAPALRLELHH